MSPWSPKHLHQKLPHSEKKPLPERFFLLDILRGLASLAIVVWHYQHFYYTSPGNLSKSFSADAQPFYEWIYPLYERGEVAVNLFFVLSGFVFFYQYLGMIQGHRISLKHFVMRRFARLYPLHFVTLVFVGAGQYLFLKLNGSFVVYGQNRLSDFLLHLFFASEWVPGDMLSFNGPVWSVSYEVAVYIIYFIFALLFGGVLFLVLLLAVCGACLWYLKGLFIGMAVCLFFLGGAVFLIYEKIRNHPRFSRLAIPVGMLALASAIGLKYADRLYQWEDKTLVASAAIFPALVYLLAALQDLSAVLGRTLRVIGDITYSTYMIHFPLQMAFIGCSVYFRWNISYLHPAVFLAYVALIIGIGIPTHYLFERPAQKYLRRKFRCG